MNHVPTKESIENCHKAIHKVIHKTPILTSQQIDTIAGAKLFFKCENFQKAGAFKFRGASNAVQSLSEKDMCNGVGTHSSGNHAAALALAANQYGIKARIVMPETAPIIKVKAVKQYGGEITFCEPTLDAREEMMSKVISEYGVTLIHPYDNYKIIEGQATCAKEIIEEVSELDYIIAPCGGGGLLSGTALSAKYFSPKTKVIGAEPKNADDAFRSIRDSKIYPPLKPNTIADGLLTALSEKTFGIIKENVSEIITVTEKEIVEAMRLVWERMKIIIEASSAVPLAVVLKEKEKFRQKKIALILSGGNVDVEKLPFNLND